MRKLIVTCLVHSFVCAFAGILLFALMVSSTEAEEKPRPEDIKFFEERIRPVLVANCYSCHNSGDTREGGLALDHRAGLRKGGQSGPAIIPGDPAKSLLLKLVRHEVEGREMPEGEAKLKPDVLKDFERWIKLGAPDPRDEPPSAEDLSRLSAWESVLAKRKDWWSFQPVQNVEPPTVADERFAGNPIDRFIHRKLEEQKLMPSPRAARNVLIRRASYDLIGLPPTPGEIGDFTNDTAPNAWEKVVDRLLASPHYGEQWGRHWLDVVRFGESNGFERNILIENLWPFRDYVSRSFNDDKAFDQLVREHLAGDVLAPGDRRVHVGTAFLVCGPYDNVGNQDAKAAAQIRANTIDEMVRATGETFLGLTIGCARCHHHKFDPIGQRDYYAMSATFAGVSHGDRPLATPEERRERSRKLKPLLAEKSAAHEQIRRIEDSITQRSKDQAEEIARGWTRPPIDRKRTEETFPPVKARYVRLLVEGTESNPASKAGCKIDEFEVWTSEEPSRNVALSENGGKAFGESRTAEDFAGAYSAMLAIDGKFGERWIAADSRLTIELAEPALVHKVVFSSDRSGAAKDHNVAEFLSEYRIQTSDDGIVWTTMARSHDRQPISEAHRNHRLRQAIITKADEQRLSELHSKLANIETQIKAVPDFPAWWVGRFSQPSGPTHVFLGGDPQRPGETVSASSLEALDECSAAYELPEDAPEGRRRLALANWIVHPENPLTARVIVNRVWQYHFGTGLVDTPSDFGAMGGKPTHPELLDWLALKLMTPADRGGFGWRLKPLHRLILLSETYQQSSDDRTEAAEKDADARFLWRFPPRRLSAEEIRDTMLSISGTLDTKAGGPGFRLYRYLQDNVATYVPLEEHPPETYRRSVYHQNARAAEVDLMSDFDAPDPAFAAPRRSATVTPLQALTMMNHQFPLDMAEAWAEQIEAAAGSNHDDQIRRAYQQAFGRSPDEAERAKCQAVIERHGLRIFCRAIFNSNEFLYLR